MKRTRDLIDQITRDLQPVVEQLEAHPYIAAVEAGEIPREELRRFAGEQYLTIESDLRSVAHLVSRYGGMQARGFFLDTLAGEGAALEALTHFGRALEMTEDDLRAWEPLPGANGYTCYMAWLAAYGDAAEVAAAYLVNFPAWGRSCGRLARALRERYSMNDAEVRFFDQFAAESPEFANSALAVIRDGLDRGADEGRIHRAARLLQGYELLYWDTLWAAARNEITAIEARTAG